MMEATKAPAAMEEKKAPAAEAGPADHKYYEEWLSQGKYGGVMIEGHLYETDRWSPWIGCCNRSIYATRNNFNLLVMRDPRDESQEKIIGDLATSWEWADDGNSVTFNLWEGATWTDGEPVTADDVVFSLDEMADLNKVRPRTRNIEPYYKSSEAIDPQTVKVNTKFPNPAALLPFLTVDFMVIHPKHILEPLGLDDPADHFDDPDNVVGVRCIHVQDEGTRHQLRNRKEPHLLQGRTSFPGRHQGIHHRGQEPVHHRPDNGPDPLHARRRLDPEATQRLGKRTRREGDNPLLR